MSFFGTTDWHITTYWHKIQLIGTTTPSDDIDFQFGTKFILIQIQS